MQNTEENFTDYLNKYNFQKRLDKLTKKLDGKSVIIYGTGKFFDAIRENYDISMLNIIGIADMKFSEHEENEEYLGYKVYSPKELKSLNADYVIVATKFYVNIIENLYYDLLKGTKTKITPFVKKGFFSLLKEAFMR